MIPGECRSCGTTTREHANDCQYVAIKENIGLCTYCQGQDHRYAACPQQALDQETVAREMRKNKKNNKKRGKVEIVAGIMTREQESDSTLAPEKEEGGVETLPHKDWKEGEGINCLTQSVCTIINGDPKRGDVLLLWSQHS